MVAVRLDAVIPRSRKLAITVPTEIPVGDVEVIIVSRLKTRQSNKQTLLQYLRQHRLAPEHRRSAADLDTYIEQERTAWE
ncbi:MAG TPA: hypothetical protein PK170_07550 [Anaerolineae bacterium]|nr:hypothetical protein [Anaerolineae bacterium]